jgi:integrase
MSIEVIGHKLKNIEFNTPIITKTDQDNYKTDYKESFKQGAFIESVKLLYYVERDQHGRILDYRPVVPANNYLLYLTLIKKSDDTNQTSNGLIQYFTKLLEWNDGKDKFKFNDEIHEPWNTFVERESSRPTYQFKTYLEDAVKSNNEETQLAYRTASAYMLSVRNMYKYYISKGYIFQNPPMQYEVITFLIPAGPDSMKEYQKLHIETTDLRLNVDKSERKKNLLLLQALSDEQHAAFIAVIRSRRVLKSKGNQIFTESSLSIEIAYMCLLMNSVGLRREEVSTLRVNHIRLPTEKELKNGYVSILIGPNNGVCTKGDQARTVKFPAHGMKKLYQYMQTKRYISRKNKFIANQKAKEESLKKEYTSKGKEVPVDKLSDIANEPIYLFLTAKGECYAKDTLTSRWAEIRNIIKVKFDIEFIHKMHNLRPTYAVRRLKTLINSGMKHGEAISQLQLELGHLDPDTTNEYLKQATNAGSGHEISERVTGFLFESQGIEIDFNLGDFE